MLKLRILFEVTSIFLPLETASRTREKVTIIMIANFLSIRGQIKDSQPIMGKSPFQWKDALKNKDDYKYSENPNKNCMHLL